MAMVNMNNLLNGKDSRWLQLEVCREFQRNKCSRPDTECKFAHPPANVEVQNGRVTACYDSIKGRCNREKPPCKYFHPPQHLKDQLLINGRNHLALKNALMQQMGLTPGQPLVPGQVQAVAANPYLTGMPQVGSTYSPYFAPGPIMPTIMGPDPGVGSPLGVVPQTVVAQQKMPRSDRLEMDMKSVGSFYYENFAFPAGMVPYKRPAADKSGVPVYQPNATTYQQLMQLQQPFVPVSCEYSTSPAPPPTSSCASPTVPEASQSIATSSMSQTSQITLQQQQQQQSQSQPLSQSQQQIQQTQQQSNNKKEAETVNLVTTTAAMPVTLPQQSQIPDPAAIAKEVAQHNYAKAIKLAAVNQSLAASHFTHLNPLNYTGVSLNKQTLAAVPQQSAAAAAAAAAASYPRYQAAAAMPFQFNATAINLGLANPYQANLLNMSRPPQMQFNPYSIMRQPYATAAGTAAANSLYANSLLSAQYPVTVSAPPMTNNTSQATIAVAAAPANNNNNVVLQPYKKLKTN